MLYYSVSSFLVWDVSFSIYCRNHHFLETIFFTFILTYIKSAYNCTGYKRQTNKHTLLHLGNTSLEVLHMIELYQERNTFISR